MCLLRRSGDGLFDPWRTKRRGFLVAPFLMADGRAGLNLSRESSSPVSEISGELEPVDSMGLEPVDPMWQHPNRVPAAQGPVVVIPAVRRRAN